MFKALGNLIHRTPWWGLILFGVATLIALVLFATPVQVLRLSSSGATPAEQRAIQREIHVAFGDSALNVAEEIVTAMKERSTDAERTAEFERALGEIARAREELTKAQHDVAESTQETAREARQTALEAARDAADTALATATEARQAIEESRDEALDKLRDKGVDLTPTTKSFDDLIKAAKVNETKARDALNAIEGLLKSKGETKDAAAQNAPPKRGVTLGKSVTIDINMDDKGKSAITLPPELRGDIHSKVNSDVWRIAVGSVLILVFIPFFVVILIAKVFIGRSRRALAFADEKEKQAAVSDVSRQVTEARLQALQAQVEPHFLYNTLANVQALTEVDPPAANQMVGHLIGYLRAALPKMRENTSTVGQELELVRSYLNILQMRMGARLTFSIEAPDELLTCPFPPMMLPSLVENAIKHGLEPSREGGHIGVVVSRVTNSAGDRICVEVRDTGRGLSEAPIQSGSGVGLTNIRERLAAIYGGRASFVIEANAPRGVVATISVPNESQQTRSYDDPAKFATTPSANANTPKNTWTRTWSITSKTHSAWARIVSRTFLVLMMALVAILLVAFVSLYTGWLPVQFGDVQVDGLEGMALGSVGLLVAFVIATLAAAVVVAILYGLGFLFAGLLLLIPAIILLSVFPVLSPFILIALVIYWLVRKK